MKRILIFAIVIASTHTAFSQSLGYNDLGILFSKDDNYGTARFEAMSGAFGALGGDVSSLGINPAGASVAKKSVFSATLSNRNTEYSSMYYGNTTNIQDNYLDISQAGGILSFDTAYNSEWNRFALSFNYRVKKDFDVFYSAEGNSNNLFYSEHVADSKTVKTQFDGSIEQYNSSRTQGQTSVFNVGFSAVHQNKLFLGASVNFHDIEFYREAYFNEVNDDINGNKLDVESYSETSIQGSGISLSLGFIYKLNQNLRVGLAYETPTWYQEVIEDYFQQFSGLKKWLDNQKRFIEDNGFIYSHFGRKRRLPNVFSEDRGIASHEVRSGINFLVQSIASDVNLLGAIDAHNEIDGSKGKIFALVHDSILAEVDEDYVDEYMTIVKNCIQKDRGMSIPDCPVGCDFDVGDDYSFGKFEEKYETK